MASGAAAGGRAGLVVGLGGNSWTHQHRCVGKACEGLRTYLHNSGLPIPLDHTCTAMF